jgi:dipeptidyl aminopeptidase/acylaminoacyl peptidase
MSDARELLRRGVGDYVPEPDGFDRVLRRRDRKRRNRRVGAGVVAVAIVAIGAALFISQYGNNPVPATPILRPPTGWVVFSATDISPRSGLGSRDSTRDLYVVGEGVDPQRIVGSPGDQTDQFCPAIAPDGSTLAYLSATGGGFLGRGGGAARLEIAPLGDDGSLGPSSIQREIHPDGVNPCPRWAPDGSRLAVIDSGRVLILGTDGTVTTLSAITGVTDLTWSPDSTQLAIRQDSTVSIVSDGSPREVASGLGGGDVNQLAWSADGLAIGAARSPHGGNPAQAEAFIRIVDPSTGKGRDVRVGPHGWVDDVTWLPDGRIAFTDGSSIAKVVDPQGAAGPSVLERGPVLQIASSPDGRSIVAKALVGNGQGEGYALLAVPVDGGPPQQLTPVSLGEEYSDLDW